MKIIKNISFCLLMIAAPNMEASLFPTNIARKLEKTLDLMREYLVLNIVFMREDMGLDETSNYKPTAILSARQRSNQIVAYNDSKPLKMPKYSVQIPEDSPN